MTKRPNPRDDLWQVLYYNYPDTFQPDDVKEIVAEVPGEADGPRWWWVLKLGHRKYTLLSGGCCYTGWDCQSSVTEYDVQTTALKAAKQAPTEHWGSSLNPRKNLVNQIRGKQPKFTAYYE